MECYRQGGGIQQVGNIGTGGQTNINTGAGGQASGGAPPTQLKC